VNLPNKLTVSRMVMAPLLFVAFQIPLWLDSSWQTFSIIAVLVLFVLIEATDLLDGIIARRCHLVTDLGKVMDPFADTFSRLTYFVCLSSVGIMPLWTFVIIVWREFSIVFLRMLMMGKGVAVPANIWGKSKAVLYAISAVFGFMFIAISHWAPKAVFLTETAVVINIVFALAAIASVASFATYVSAVLKSGSLKNMSR